MPILARPARAQSFVIATTSSPVQTTNASIENREREHEKSRPPRNTPGLRCQLCGPRTQIAGRRGSPSRRSVREQKSGRISGSLARVHVRAAPSRNPCVGGFVPTRGAGGGSVGRRRVGDVREIALRFRAGRRPARCAVSVYIALVCDVRARNCNLSGQDLRAGHGHQSRIQPAQRSVRCP